jgi:hypothetical protein
MRTKQPLPSSPARRRARVRVRRKAWTAKDDAAYLKQHGDFHRLTDAEIADRAGIPVDQLYAANWPASSSHLGGGRR